MNAYEHKKPSPRQLDTLRVIYRYTSKEGVAPTLREICDHLGIGSTNAANDHVKALTRRGLLFPSQGRSRALRLTTKGFLTLGVAPRNVIELATELELAAAHTEDPEARRDLQLAAELAKSAAERIAPDGSS